jgi:hypothetical protein
MSSATKASAAKIARGQAKPEKGARDPLRCEAEANADALI